MVDVVDMATLETLWTVDPKASDLIKAGFFRGILSSPKIQQSIHVCTQESYWPIKVAEAPLGYGKGLKKCIAKASPRIAALCTLFE